MTGLIAHVDTNVPARPCDGEAPEPAEARVSLRDAQPAARRRKS